jgi:hypothetical protein
MKKYGVVLLVMAIALTLVASVAGCGGSKNKDLAKQYMTAGDAEYDLGVKAYEQMQTAQADAVTKLMGGQTSDMDAMLQTLKTAGDAMRTHFTAAKVEYEKILPLTGVDDYVTYANMQIDVIDLYIDLLNAGDTFLTQVMALFTSGQTPDVMSILQSPEMMNLQQIGTDIQKLEKEAKNFKSEKKLAS